MSDPAAPAPGSVPPVPAAPDFGYGAAPAQPAAPQPGAVPQAGAVPQYGAVPQQGQPQYGAVSQYGTAPQYGTPPQYGAVPQYQATPAPRGTGWNAPGVKAMVFGFGVAALALIITVATFVFAEPGSHFLLLWGPIIFGTIAGIRGIVAFAKRN